MTMLRSSSAEIASRRADGSPPSSRTTRSVERDSSQMTGRITRATKSTTGATASAIPSARCSARRFGASSPSTREKKEITTVIEHQRHRSGHRLGHAPRRSRTGLKLSARVAAPKAADRNPNRVTPTCSAARKVFGFALSRSTA